MLTALILSFYSASALLAMQTTLPVLHLGPDSIEARDHVRLLGVTLSSDLGLDRHANTVRATSFYWLRRSRQSLDTDSATTLVHAFVSSRVDHCNAVYGRRSKSDY